MVHKSLSKQPVSVLLGQEHFSAEWEQVQGTPVCGQCHGRRLACLLGLCVRA